jgi:hypothetical protein
MLYGCRDYSESCAMECRRSLIRGLDRRVPTDHAVVGSKVPELPQGLAYARPRNSKAHLTNP